MSDTPTPGEPVWQWWASDDEENYRIGPCLSRDQVIEEATQAEIGWHEGLNNLRFHIIEASKVEIQLAALFEIGEWFEFLENGPLYDAGNPEDDGLTSKIKPEDADELEARIRKVIAEWQAERKIVLVPWLFDDSRNGEWVTVPLAGDATEEHA